MMTAESIFIDVAGGRIHALLWGEGPPLVFAHATGMCAQLYQALLAPLGAHYRVIAFDARGHGQTCLPADPGTPSADWRQFRADLIALLRALDVGPVCLAGHSFGATVAFEAAAETDGLADRIILIEPAFIPFAHADAYRALRNSGVPPPNPLADQVIRRRAHFPDRASMRAAYAGRGVFAGWPDDALDAYLEGGTRADEKGLQLACAPDFEAATYRGVSTTLKASLQAATGPITLIHGDSGSTVPAEDAAAIAAMRPDATIHCIAGGGHFLPITDAERVRPLLRG